MNKKSIILALTTIIMASCGSNKLWTAAPTEDNRKIASTSMQQFIQENQATFAEEISEKMFSLHSYYLIGQKNLQIFDQLIETTTPDKLYQSQAYLNLIAVRTQVEEIEEEIIDAWGSLKSEAGPKSAAMLQESEAGPKSAAMLQKLENKIFEFSQVSPLTSLSMENLIWKLFSKLPKKNKNNLAAFNNKILKSEIAKMESAPEFIVYEKKIEHLAHKLSLENSSEARRFFPSNSKQGNITGNEFPAKVWSLTYDDGPGKTTTPIILKNLIQKGLKATFFQLTKQVQAFPAIGNAVREANMEIASHSYSHLQLTKVGPETLEKEITQAAKDLKRAHGKEIRFFRLPYGAGVNNTQIREKITQNNLIHVFWNVDTLDWMAQEPSKIVERTIALMAKTPNDAGVLLFHDIHQRTVDATAIIMDHLKKDGRRVCTLDEIVNDMNMGAAVVCAKK